MRPGIRLASSIRMSSHRRLGDATTTNRLIRGIANSLLFFSILLVSALLESEIGGPESIYNAINVALIGVFLLLNREFNHGLVLAFAVPLAFLAMSVGGNLGDFGPGGYRTVGATAIGYALFMLKPVPLHHRLLRRIVTIFLIAALALSLFVFTQGPMLDFGGGNVNFNRNPNGASVFFVSSVMLSLAVVKGLLGWMLVVPFTLLTVTTTSRAGAGCVAMILLGYSVFSQAAGRQRQPWTLSNLKSNRTVCVAAALVVVLAAQFIPDAVDLLVMRFKEGGSRFEAWNDGMAGIRSMRGLLFGGGPATLSLRTESPAHNSYIEAIGNNGVFFLMTTLLALFAWLRRLVHDGCRDMLWILPPVLVYGLVENILFNGIGTLWLLTMLLGIALQSRQAGLDVAKRARARGPSPARRAPYRQLVTTRVTPASPIRYDQ